MNTENKETSSYEFLSKITRSNNTYKMTSVSLLPFFNGIALKTLFLIGILLLTSCSSEKGNPDRFKQGVFEVPGGKGYSKTIITRIDSLQIEEYDRIISISNDSLSEEKRIKHIDTLYIKWKNNFFYSLKMKYPKNQLDKDVIYVQITKITKNSYDFSAKIGFNKFLTNGTIYKIK